MFGSQKELRLTAEQIKTIVEMLKKEEHIEAMKAFLAGTIPYPPPSSSPPPDPEFSPDPAKVIKQKLSVDPVKIISNETRAEQALNKLSTDMKQEK